jgi:hypothetical protein
MEMNEILLPCYGIEIYTYDSPDGMGGTIVSDLDPCSLEEEDEDVLAGVYDAVETLVLALACAGHDITAPSFVKGLETAVECLTNTYG